MQLLKIILSLTLLVTSCQAPSPKTSVPNDPKNRIVNHALGETAVPTEPKRIVVLDFLLLNNLLALSVQPIGAAGTNSPQRPFTDYLQDKLDTEVAYVGYVYQPNLEKIAQLNPDLIMGSKNHEIIYSELSAIAPTILSTVETSGDWKQALKLVAKAVGKTQDANALLENYQQRITAFREAMGERLTETEVSLVNFRPGEVRLYLQESFPGSVLAEVGLSRPSAQDHAGFATTVSLEQIEQLDGDVMFAIAATADVTTFKRYRNHPLWQQLKVVQQGEVYQVDSEIWIFASGIGGANLILDDLFQSLLDREDLPNSR